MITIKQDNHDYFKWNFTCCFCVILYFFKPFSNIIPSSRSFCKKIADFAGVVFVLFLLCQVLLQLYEINFAAKSVLQKLKIVKASSQQYNKLIQA